MSQNDGVIMTMNPYEQKIILERVPSKLEAAEKQVDLGKVLPAKEALAVLIEKYGVKVLWIQ